MTELRSKINLLPEDVRDKVVEFMERVLFRDGKQKRPKQAYIDRMFPSVL